MTTSALAAELVRTFDHVPPALVESTVRAATAGPGDGGLTAEEVARADVTALAEAMRRAGSGGSR